MWTGGHEENNRFRSINNCHVGGASEWGAVDAEHMAALHAAVLSHFGVDLYRDEGKYFPDPDFCRAHGIPVRVGLQRAGDSIILKGSTMHWVRSCGRGSMFFGTDAEDAAAFAATATDADLLVNGGGGDGDGDGDGGGGGDNGNGIVTSTMSKGRGRRRRGRDGTGKGNGAASDKSVSLYSGFSMAECFTFSQGFSVNSSWNFGDAQSLDQLKEAFVRYAINNEMIDVEVDTASGRSREVRF